MKAAQQNHSSRFALVLVIITLCFATFALAGPPLICHAFEIGQAHSLPLASNSWNLSGSENYNTKNLANDTLEILQPDTPVLVRMETLRRATLYARRDPLDRKSTRLNSSHSQISYAVFCLKKKTTPIHYLACHSNHPC